MKAKKPHRRRRLLRRRRRLTKAPNNRFSVLQRRASFQTRKGRCSTLNCCMILSLNRFRFKESCSKVWKASPSCGAFFYYPGQFILAAYSIVLIHPEQQRVALKYN
ncbi:hypothetical protein CHY08_05610 [Rhizobium leguminosarum bv. viciae]|nr:hypothetical protein CHY08_05610 [Rhizobium leguminosarum bv. viciae]